MDLILREARLMDGRVVDIGVTDGVIEAIESGLSQTAATELQAHGQLTIPAFVNGQLHACKSSLFKHAKSDIWQISCFITISSYKFNI